MPDAKIEPRFQRVLVNLERAITALPVVVVFNNTDLARPFRLEAVYEAGTRIGPWPRPIICTDTTTAALREASPVNGTSATVFRLTDCP